MMPTKVTFVFIVLLLLAMNTAFAQKTAAIKQDAYVSVTYTTSPVMKHMPFNSLMRVRVTVPEGKEVTYNSIQLQLDTEAVKAIEKLEVLIRDDSKRGFLDGATLLASVQPTTTLINIPIDWNCKAGLNHIWISAVLKSNANIDRKLEIKTNSLTTVTGNKQSVAKVITQEGIDYPEYTRRMGVAVRKAWDDSVHTYRIPGIITTDKGTLIAVYDIRYKNSGDLPANIDVGMSRSTDGGRTWEPMKIIMDMGAPHENNGVGDPSVLFDPVTKKLWVAALWSKGNRSIRGSEPGLSEDTTGQFVLVSSGDDGVTWSTPHSITSQVKDPAWHLYFDGPGNGIVMQNGTLVFPSQYWDESKKPGIPHSSIIYSEDHGKTWKSGTGAKYNTTESAVVETTPGTLMLNMRDNRGKYRSVATTTNLGKTWTEHQTSYQDLPDPVSMASLIKARVNVKGKMKDVLFFSNVASQTVRQNTTIKTSLDLGETWPEQNRLLLDTRITYGYSALTRIDNNTIGILYEGDNGELYFLRIPVSEIIK
jgi:sialidase-1